MQHTKTHSRKKLVEAFIAINYVGKRKMSNKKVNSVLYGAIRLVKSNFGFCIVETGHQTLEYIFK